MKKAANDTLKNDALLKEIEQDVKNEQLKSLWDKYGLFIIIAVALILTAAVSFETFKTWRAKRAQELSNAYAVAVSLQNQGRFDESLNILQNLAKANRGIYGDVAKLQIANIYFEQGKTPKPWLHWNNFLPTKTPTNKCATLPQSNWLLTNWTATQAGKK